MKHRFKLESKLFFLLTIVTIAVIFINSYINYSTSMSMLKKQAYDCLTAIREMKAGQVEDYLGHIRHQVLTLSESRMVIDAMKSFTSAYQTVAKEEHLSSQEYDAARERLKRYYEKEFLPRLASNTVTRPNVDTYLPDTINTILLQDIYISNNAYDTGKKQSLKTTPHNIAYNSVHEQYHPIFLSYLEKFGYYDIFLVDHKTGRIVYSVFKEVDFATSLLNGPYQTTNFAKAFRAAAEANDKEFVKLVDFAPYHPSYNTHASFIASPIYDGDEKIGVLMFQMPVDKMNEVMTNHYRWRDVGLGESGETYLVGNDYTLRTQSRFLKEDKANYLKMVRDIGLPEKTVNLIDTFNSSIGLQQVKTKGTISALKGASGTETFRDYRGVMVLSSYRPLNIPDVTWVIMSEIDATEAFQAVDSMRDRSIGLFFVLLFGIIIISGYFSKRLTQPIKNLQADANALAGGNLDVEIKKERNDEIGELATAFDAMRNAIRKSLFDLQDINRNLERTVQKRTEQIQIAYNELDQYKNALEFKVEKEIKRREETTKVKKQMEGELNVAHDIQMSLIPLLFPVFTDHKEFSIHADIKPAREVGGDFYDFYFIDENHLCVVIGDVSGKGIPAALFMAVTKTLIKSRAADDLSPASILSYVNNEMSEDNPASMFVTLFIGVIDLNSGTMLYSNAGHNPPYIVKDDGSLTSLRERHGPIVGALEGLTFKENTVALRSKDKLVLFTDGVTEAMNGNNELFGEERLKSALMKNYQDEPEALIEKLMQAVSTHEAQTPQSDDITVLVFKFIGKVDFTSEAFSISNNFSALPKVLKSFERFAKQCGIAVALIYKVNIALDDLLNNIISYAYEDELEHTIDIHFECNEDKLSIIISDDGMPFNPFDGGFIDTALPLEGRQVGGLGIHLVKEMMDGYTYARKINKNVVTLTLYLSQNLS